MKTPLHITLFPHVRLQQSAALPTAGGRRGDAAAARRARDVNNAAYLFIVTDPAMYSRLLHDALGTCTIHQVHWFNDPLTLLLLLSALLMHFGNIPLPKARIEEFKDCKFLPRSYPIGKLSSLTSKGA